MKILRQVRSKACGWRGAPDRFHIEVVAALFHGQVFEVERTSSNARPGTARRIRRWFGTETVTKHDRWRLHGSQWGRMFHCVFVSFGCAVVQNSDKKTVQLCRHNLTSNIRWIFRSIFQENFCILFPSTSNSNGRNISSPKLKLTKHGSFEAERHRPQL